MGKIQAVIFDVGGVLHKNVPAVQTDFKRRLNINDELLDTIWANEIPRLGCGEVSESQFWQILSAKYGLDQVDTNENVFGRTLRANLRPNLDVLALVRRLKELNLKTAVLSNTIEPHAKVIRAAGLFEGFDAVLLSHEIHCRKPELAAYRCALQALGVQAQAAVFVDDLAVNVQAARRVGMRGICFKSSLQLKNDLKMFIAGL